MATVTKRRKGWQARIRRKGFAPLAKSFATKAEAEQWAASIERDPNAMQALDRAKRVELSVWDLLDRYVREELPKKRSGPKEANKLRFYMRHPLLARPAPFQRPRDFAQIRDERLREVSGGTVRREFAVLSHMYETARKEWFLELDNPIKQIRLPSANPSRTRRLAAGEYERLRGAAGAYGGEIPDLIDWLLSTAMRRSEALSLTVADIDRDQWVAEIKQSKNGKPRVIPLVGRAREIAEKRAGGESGGRLFNLRPDAATQAFRRVCGRSGIDGLTLHDLRHEAVSRLVESGLSMPEVMAISGHLDHRSMLIYYQPCVSSLRGKLEGSLAGV